jgi:hypothetical protein
MNKIKQITLITLTLTLTLTLNSVFAEEAKKDSESELAMKLQNPVANLISVPFQNNWDFGIGSTKAMQYKVNVQPVLPFSISDKWNLITRTIMPIYYQESPVAGGKSLGGLGDINQTFFFSPKQPIGG